MTVRFPHHLQCVGALDWGGKVGSVGVIDRQTIHRFRTPLRYAEAKRCTI